jgi:phosphoribosylformylglycinamidine (FGAM) synthase PurS component
MAGGHVHGREAVREYWARQWTIVSPNVEPMGFHRTADGAIVVEVRQTIRDLEGKPLQGQTHGLKDKMVEHVFRLRNGKVARFDIRDAAHETATEPEMSKALSNKVALITGSSRGIGRAAALALAKEGASFIGVHYASNADAAHATVREIESLGAKAVAIAADLKEGKKATDSIWHQFKTAAIATTGEPWLDILVNNAGVAPAVSLAHTSEPVFDETMTINRQHSVNTAGGFILFDHAA